MRNVQKTFRSISQKGLTFIELIAGLGITSALTVMAIPSFDALTPGSEAEVVISSLSQDIEFAKTAAVSNNAKVTLCNSADASSCNGDWNDGWLVFIDNNGDRKVSEDDVVLRTGSKAAGTKVFMKSSIKHSVQFNAQGFASNTATYQVCNEALRAEEAHGLIINRSGLTLAANDSNGDSIRENHDQTPFTCQG